MANQGNLKEGDVFTFVDGRQTGEWVVERTAMTGGGTGHGPHDIYPDGWHVTARRLTATGAYDPTGVTTKFYQSGCFTNMVMPHEVVVVRRMRRTFI